MRRDKLIYVLAEQQTIAYHMLVPELQSATKMLHQWTARLHRDSRYVRAFTDVRHPRPPSESVAKRDTTLRLLAAADMSLAEYLTDGRANHASDLRLF